MPSVNWWITTDNAIYARGLKDQVDGTYQNAATVTATLIDAAGDDVTDAVDLVLTYQTGSDGDYLGHLPDTVVLTEGSTYRLRVTATDGTYVLTEEVTGIADYKPAGQQ